MCLAVSSKGMPLMALKGANQELARPYNRRIVLEAIRQHGPIPRGDIADRVGLTVQTVSTITRELEEQDYILSARDLRKSRGYPSTNLSINPDGGYAIGLNLTPRGLHAGLVNFSGEVVAREERELPHAAPDTVFPEIDRMVKLFRRLRPDRRMLGAGLAMPGPFDIASMSFVGPTTLEGWQGVNMEERLREAAKLPVFIEVDHAAAALGERLYGAGRDFRSFYYLYFGVGLGGCMVQDGEPVRGSFGNAGEIGHMPLVPGGEPCSCGNCGCLERYVSGEAYERRVRQIGAKRWLSEAVPVFRSAIAVIENLFDPETIILGSYDDEVPLAELISAANPFMNSISARSARLAPRVTCSSEGRDAVLRGAAALAVRGVLSPRLGANLHGSEAGRDPLFKRRVAA